MEAGSTAGHASIVCEVDTKLHKARGIGYLAERPALWVQRLNGSGRFDDEPF
jgi:hypothetical protein